MNTFIEQILSRVHSVLFDATDAAHNVVRNRADALPAQDELPAISVKRGAFDSAAFASNAEKALVGFSLEFFVAGASREQNIDALHGQAHALLLADAQLQTLGSGLRLTAIDEPEHAEGDPQLARMTAHYSLQKLYRTGNIFASSL